MLKIILLIFSTCFIQVTSFGAIGHYLSGFIADQFLEPQTRVFLSSLNPQNLSKIATWADEIKSNYSYHWANELHYIDTQDAPPRRCGYSPSDCINDTCIVSAIHNYTRRLIQDKSTEALNFLVHFIGDIHQPLHLCGRDRGGTRAFAKYHGARTNMHSMWDSLLYETRIRKDFQGNKNAFGFHLIDQIKSKFQSKEFMNDWIDCTLYKDPFNVHSCPDKWAQYSNSVNCQYVWPGYKPRRELGDEYYNYTIPIAELLLSQAGFRIASVLNAIVSKSSTINPLLIQLQ